MPKLVILGSANAVPDGKHENTHLALVGKERMALIDCVGTPVVRLSQAGLDVSLLTDLVLTHFHPDHVSGVPSLLMSLWLLGRDEPLNVYGFAHTLQRVETMMQLYEWERWPGFFRVDFHRLPEEEMAPVFSSKEFRLFASPVRHFVPTIGLRVEFPESGQVLAYSCDTEPAKEVVHLASGADVLIHEATGAYKGHSSAAQAGAVAQEAEVGRLLLIHYRTRDVDARGLLSQASEAFLGPVALAEDFMEIEF